MLEVVVTSLGSKPGELRQTATEFSSLSGAYRHARRAVRYDAAVEVYWLAGSGTVPVPVSEWF